jgi:hypothetical protein
MSKRQPLGTTGKLALAAGKRSRARQLLDREQRKRDRRDLLSLVGKNSSLAVSSGSGQGTPSRDERYAARVASAEKARLNVALSAVLTNIRAQGITDVAEKIVFDGDGGMLDAADLGTNDDDNADDSLSGTSGSSGGGARMRSEHEERDAAEALVTLPVPGVIVEVVVVPEYFSCCVDTHCRSFDDQTSPRQLCINCNCIAHLACSENFVFQNPVDMEFVVTVKDFTRAAKSRIRATPKSQHGNLFFCLLCMAKIRAAKEMKTAKKMPNAPRKSTNVKFPTKILLELRRLVAFHCQAFVFLECEKNNRAGTYALMEERFYGNPEK